MSIFVCSFDEQVFGLDIDIATITYIGDIDIRFTHYFSLFRMETM
jgi:hypothetical protein